MTPSTAIRTMVECLRAQPETPRAGMALHALARAVAKDGGQVSTTASHAAVAPWLLLWGPGAPDRIVALRRQIAGGGRVVALDLAYWSRQRKVRIAIDAAHPQAWVMRKAWPSSRFLADPVPVSDRWNPDGPVVIAGIGQKARVQYGQAAAEWEADMLSAARARWGRPVLYRCKKPGDPMPSGAALASSAPIDRVLTGCSLVVTWHSNVAVDAIRMGIPAVCRDGAAAAVCPSELPDVPTPLPVTIRDRFLANLAWFQWDLATEASACWRFVQELVA